MGKLVNARRQVSHASTSRIVEAAAWLGAAVLLGIAAIVYADSYLYQHASRDAILGRDDASSLSDAAPLPTTRKARARPGTPIARLVVPRLDLDVVVAEGTSERTLRRAVGRVESSAAPGERGNVVLAGHRDTFFRPLAEIEPGDLILLESRAGTKRYRVEWTRVVDPRDVQVMARSDDPALTLITCYPFRYVGNAPRRFVVRARGHGS